MYYMIIELANSVYTDLYSGTVAREREKEKKGNATLALGSQYDYTDVLNRS